MKNKTENLGKYIDHTALKAVTTVEDIKKLCDEAKEYNFASVCVNPYYVEMAHKLLVDSDVKVCTVIGFPLGATTKEAKAFEAVKAVADGAQEVDMVMNVSAFKSCDFKYVEEDIRLVVNSIPREICVKVILETCYLTLEEVKKASELAMYAGADFVKTSTGFGTGGATVENVRAMKGVVGNKLEVKASGGVKNLETVNQMIKAGATRIGTSSGIEIIKGEKSEKAY
ncbi:MAG: deoxyribose-phosphate aldolase [Victivallales bacterium]|nr:deoxyribose-phosphate aldolase [Victivallales bacterium]